DDPEALLEGVAMAGLVGILRQLGDLAESHALIARIQQLEAEFPFVEMALLCQTDH
ncbi:hypothetical protein EUTSA_v10002989mg, partial [Eutrema salsugineum]